MTATKISAVDMTAFNKWLDKYTVYFAAVDNDVLESAWWLHGRDSEKTVTTRALAVWAAVNAEMQSRGL